MVRNQITSLLNIWINLKFFRQPSTFSDSSKQAETEKAMRTLNRVRFLSNRRHTLNSRLSLRSGNKYRVLPLTSSLPAQPAAAHIGVSCPMQSTRQGHHCDDIERCRACATSWLCLGNGIRIKSSVRPSMLLLRVLAASASWGELTVAGANVIAYYPRSMKFRVKWNVIC